MDHAGIAVPRTTSGKEACAPIATAARNNPDDTARVLVVLRAWLRDAPSDVGVIQHEQRGCGQC